MSRATELATQLRKIAHELRTYNPDADEYKGQHIHGVWAREIDAAIALHDADRERQAGEAVAWVRRHPDGALTAEFLEDAVIEPARKQSGAWVPLGVLASLPAPQAVQDPRKLTIHEFADLTAPWADVRSDKSMGIVEAAILKFCEVNGIPAPSPDGKAEQAEAPSENQRSTAYDLVDRYLRNNLDDDDYAAFSAALECLYATQPTASNEQAEAPSDADPLTPEQEEWVMDLAEKHNLGRRVPQIGAMRGVAPDVFYTDASYRTHELFCFAAALLSTKELT